MSSEKPKSSWGIGSVFGSMKSSVGNVVGGAANFVGLGKSDSVETESGELNPNTTATKATRCDPIRFNSKDGKPIAGSTMSSRKRSKSMIPKEVVRDENGKEETHVWGHVDASTYNLRVGPNYKKTGAKAPSAPALYEVIGMDLLKSENRIVDIGSLVHIPEEWKVNTNNPKVPPVVIVVAQLPDVSHALSGITNFFIDKSEGPGSTVAFYFRIRPETVEALKDMTTCAPALRFFAEFCSTAAENKNYNNPKHPMAGRFKLCPLIDNIDDLGWPGFLSSYNAKPALIVQSAEVFRGDGYMCIDSNVHGFGGIARSAMQIVSLETMQMKWGFCIESREDSEMPEVLFGACFMDKPCMDVLPDWDLVLKERNTAQQKAPIDLMS